MSTRKIPSGFAEEPHCNFKCILSFQRVIFQISSSRLFCVQLRFHRAFFCFYIVSTSAVHVRSFCPFVSSFILYALCKSQAPPSFYYLSTRIRCPTMFNLNKTQRRLVNFCFFTNIPRLLRLRKTKMLDYLFQSFLFKGHFLFTTKSDKLELTKVVSYFFGLLFFIFQGNVLFGINLVLFLLNLEFCLVKKQKK